MRWYDQALSIGAILAVQFCKIRAGGILEGFEAEFRQDRQDVIKDIALNIFVFNPVDVVAEDIDL